MNKSKYIASIFLTLCLLLSLPAIAEFSNGQAAELVLGQANFDDFNSGTSATTMHRPAGVIVDPESGKVFVADSDNHRVLRFSTISTGAAAEVAFGQPDLVTANATTPPTASSLNDPQSIFLDTEGNLWVVDLGNNRVVRFADAANVASGATANLVLGQPDFISNGLAVSQTGLNGPEDVAVDETGRVWIADRANNRVLWFDSASSLTNGASASGVLGQSDFTSNGSATATNGFASPSGVVVRDNQLWVVDFLNRRVVRFDNASTLVNHDEADAVLGQPDLTTGVSLPASATTLAGPWRASFDQFGTLWVADYQGDRTLGFKNASSKANGAAADVVLGKMDFVTTGGSTSQTNALGSNHAASDTEGRLWVAEYGTSRVVRYTHAAAQPDMIAGFKSLSSGTGVIGTDSNLQKLQRRFAFRKRKAAFRFFIKNNSSTELDSFALAASIPVDNLRATTRFFYDDAEITNDIMANNYSFKSVLPGETKEIRVEVSFRSRYARKIKEEVRIQAASTIDNSLTDIAKIIAVRRAR
jgi:sugar lactone lactonase YvrE